MGSAAAAAILSLLLLTTTCTAANFSSLLVFGDSTVDTGNNNYIATLFKADHRPYGLSAAAKAATGRFSDGLLVPDMLLSGLRISDVSLPFLKPDLSLLDLRKGANFASAGSGFDDRTAAVSGVISMQRQISMFRDYVGRLRGFVGEEAARKSVEEALVMISAGSNDLTISFYNSLTRKANETIEEYHDFLLGKIEDFIREVYGSGGRKFLLWGITPIGCTPLQMTMSISNMFLRSCVERENEDTLQLNSKMEDLLKKLHAALPGSKFAFADLYPTAMDIFQNPQKYGFTEARRGCCGTGILEAGDLCNELSPVCSNPSEFVFFDSIHPTQAIYKIVTDNIMQHSIPQLL